MSVWPMLTTVALESSAAAELWIDRPLSGVEIRGLEHTRVNVVTRELQIQTGDSVNWDLVERDRLRLLDLGLFADVRVGAHRDTLTDRPVLTYRISERPTLLALPILEYDPEDKFSYGFFAAHQNFRGRHERLSIAGVLGGRQAASFSYGVPWMFGKRVGFSTSAFVRQNKKRTERIEELRQGLSLAVSPARSYETRYFFYGGIEEVKTEPLDANDPDPPPKEDEDHRWLGVQLAIDTRDFRLRPRTGSVFRIAATQHGSYLGGTTGFVRFNLDVLQVVPIRGDAALTAATRVLWSEGPIPRYQRTNLGGINTLRGLAQGEFGGESRWIGWVEQRIPLLEKRTFSAFGGRYELDYTIDGTAFVDVGAIWEGNALERGEVSPYWGGGVGLRIVMPLIQVVRIDVGTDGEDVRVYGSGGVRL